MAREPRIEPAVSFYRDGRKLTSPAILIPFAMALARDQHGIDPEEMKAITARLCRDEEARELFEEWTGLEVVLDRP